ncbi:lactoylglutathione lyase [Roseinatronobacter bogoriensis]|uniref:Lactoylglutathione lyase n=1 Tax=Roseinatronobacter bogoriensis subsp. barguzinensis TaxID=441209 RepID=A0A2K8KIA0_9RHOB|nr:MULTISPECIES: lactoylglutathione lyase [Rhodobaca]ATX65870.1 lactoylglutathione lyase [Rhodobaca barguzinensis]MBB4208162.1 lactoylglutathione lyase [Rhodobaca bogoriensis DSM 18756]TDW38803.1 lactoylglutathione lyase [Rhodobaca barguzinensis]TDY69159.1 lactoylglutathione lyase [Rhodobaca bogoriensis DSM 18756]
MTDASSATDNYVLTHTMLRIKDPARSLEFYQQVLGFRLLSKLDFEEARFSLYFLQPRGHSDSADGTLEHTFSRMGLLELTHNWGSEDDDTQMHSGNSTPKGFGHICLAVPDIAAACARFEEMGVQFQKRLGEGGMKEIAFILDPDGYWIEIVQPSLMDGLLAKFKA